MIARFDEVTGIVAQEVFADDTHRRVFRALMAHHGDHKRAEADLDPDALELLSRVEVFDVPVDADPRKEGINLLRAAVRRELARRVSDTSSAVITLDRGVKQKVEQLSGRDVADSVIADLLAWLYDVTSVIEA